MSAPLRLGRIDESFYQVVGGVVAEILRRCGHDVTVADGSHTDVYRALGTGELDLAVAFWLPYGHEEPWKRLGTAVEELATLYDGARFYWAMPDSADEAIRSIADLATEAFGRDIPRAIAGLSLDATITTASQRVVREYGLDALGFRVEPGGFAVWEASIKTAIAGRTPVVLPLWTPYYLNAIFRLRVLDDPKGILGPANRVVLGARRDAIGRIGDDAIAALRSTGLNLAVVTELDRRVHADGSSADEVAAQWVAAR